MGQGGARKGRRTHRAKLDLHGPSPQGPVPQGPIMGAHKGPAHKGPGGPQGPNQSGPTRVHRGPLEVPVGATRLVRPLTLSAGPPGGSQDPGVQGGPQIVAEPMKLGPTRAQPTSRAQGPN